jgi:hypothetical protein
VDAEAGRALQRVDEAREAQRCAGRDGEVVALAGMEAIAGGVDVDACEGGDAVRPAAFTTAPARSRAAAPSGSRADAR